MINRLTALLLPLTLRRRYYFMVDMAAVIVAQVVLLIAVLHGRAAMPVLILVVVSVVVCGSMMLLSGTHRQIWSRLSLSDAVLLLEVAAVSATLVGVASYWQFGPQAPVRAALGSFASLSTAWIGPRLFARLWWESRLGDRRNGLARAAEPIILYGSGPRAIAFIKGNAASQRYRILGILSENPRLFSRELAGVPVVGGLGVLGEALDRWKAAGDLPRQLVVTEDGETANDLPVALDAAARHALLLCRLPDPSRIMSASDGGNLQAVSIEDLLQRDTVRLGSALVPEIIAARRIMVTGAGGSIGSELVRQVATYGPEAIILVEFSEYNLYAIAHELADRFPSVPIRTALCDVRQRGDLRQQFELHRPHIVLHAAALKHVPLLEDHPDQAVMTNIRGTLNVAELAMEFAVEQMTLVSTDKAVNPTNVMGTTKRWAEMICQACESEAAALGLKTRYVCVRFGNVLGSAGSVVPLFRAQIERGGPITITHPDITRYFMTIPEACELILTACSTSAAAMERDSRVFVLDMGTPVRIIDLAERMIQLYGLTLGSDIAIKIVGLRPGEKMHEELAHAEENLVPAPFERAHLAAARTQPFSDVFAAIEQLMAMVATGDPALVRAGLRALVPEFAADQPSPSHWCPHPSVAPVNQSSQRLRAAVSAHGPL